jgi:hypothetical protein
MPLLLGSYTITVALENDNGEETYDYHDGKYHFSIVGGPEGEIGISHLPYRWHNWPGEKDHE